MSRRLRKQTLSEKRKEPRLPKKPVAVKVPGTIKKAKQQKQSAVNVSVVYNPIEINPKKLETETGKTELTYRRSERQKKLVEQAKPELRVAVEKNNSIQKSDAKREIVKHTRSSFDNV